MPGSSPPLMTWQVRQLPLPRSKASFWAFSDGLGLRRTGCADRDGQHGKQGRLCGERRSRRRPGTYRRREHRPHGVRPRKCRRPAAHQGGRADARHELPGEHLAPRRPRRRSSSPAARFANACSASCRATWRSASKTRASSDIFRVQGRGELHLTILLETCVARATSSRCHARRF